GREGFQCSPVTPLLQTTCTGTTRGDLLLAATVTVRFPLATGGTADVIGTVGGPAPLPRPEPVAAAVSSRLVLPLLPPLSPILLPPPLVPLPVPPLFRPAAAAESAGVPVIPEATPGGLLLAGLLVLAGVSRWR